MNHHVVHLGGVLGVLLGAESRETLLAEVGLEGSVARDKAVDAKVELLTANEQGSVDVLRDDVRFAQVDLVL